MKRLSKIDESVWADMHKRSNGTQIRKEDDIELLDMTGLYDYILAHYELTDKNREMTYGTHNMSIAISSEGDEILLTYGFHAVHLYFNLSKYELLETELCKRFNVSPADSYDHYIVEQGGKPTNQFFIDVLDCIIANRDTILRKKDNVSESVWADIHKRSNGDQTRKEDDINLLNADEFCDYINSNYKLYSLNRTPVTVFIITVSEYKGNYIDIPLFMEDGETVVEYASLLYHFPANKVTFTCTSDKYREMYLRKLVDEFDKPEKGTTVNVRNREIIGVTNQTVIRIIEFIIDNIKYPLEPLIKRI